MGKYDKTGPKEQTIPVINSSTGNLYDFVIDFIDQETIQLPDGIDVEAYHYKVFINDYYEPGDIHDLWVDSRGYFVYSLSKTAKWGVGEGYQMAFEKNINSGIIKSKIKGEDRSLTEWEVIKVSEEKNTLKCKWTYLPFEKQGHSHVLSSEYIFDNNYNPISFTEIQETRWEPRTITAEFFPDKVIISEKTSKGVASSTEVKAPKGYVAIRGDGFTDAFFLNKFDKLGDKTQIAPVINLARKTLHYYKVTYLGKETIQLPDKVMAEADHFEVVENDTSSSEQKFNYWIDERGYLVLASYNIPEEGKWSGAAVQYQESYDKLKNSGQTCDLLNGQYIGSVKWEVVDFGKDITIKLESFLTKIMGGHTMTIEYTLDEDFNPKSYLEQESF